MLRRAYQWLFRDRTTGRIVIGQWPNVPLWIFFGTVLARLLPLEGATRSAVEVVAFVSLMWWAIDEVVRGVNPFRRLLGAAVALMTLAGLFLS